MDSGKLRSSQDINSDWKRTKIHTPYKSSMTKPKTINVTTNTHKTLRAYCLAAGLKIQAVADQAILAWLKKASK